MHDFASKDFFISYAQENIDYAKWISQELEGAGYSTILPPRDFRPARNFILEMDEATQAKRTIAVLSPDYLNSKFTRLEWAAVLRRDPTGALGLLLPVRVLPCNVQGLLAQLIYIDLVNQDKERARKILLNGIQQMPKKLKPIDFPSSADRMSISATSTPLSRFGAPFPKNWNVSRRHAFYFTGRNEQLEQIFQGFVANDTAQMAAPQALVGLGGLGKTQTAAEYAYQYRSKYQSVLWARADTEENLKVDFQSLTRVLNLPEREDPIEAMQTWFTANSDWLLILDNADDLNLMARFFPRSPRGHVLVTTRALAAGNIARSLLLQPLLPQDGALCILRRAGTIPWQGQLNEASAFNQEAAIKISTLMDGLPLALEQAGAYIEDTASSVNRYLKLYEEYRARIIQEQFGALPNYPLPVAAAWEISKAIVKEKPATFEFLQLCAFLAPEAIPEEIFTKGASALGSTLGDAMADPLAIDRVTATLRKYSLLNREVNKFDDLGSFSIHRIIQEVLSDEMDDTTKQLWAERAVRAVALAYPSAGQPIIQTQVRHCLSLIEKWQMTFPEAEQVRQLAESTESDEGS